jgi:hypothetical protein
MRSLLLALPVLSLAACSGDADPLPKETGAPAGTDTDTDTDAATDTHDSTPLDDTIALPESPLPVVVTLGGSATGTATFDTLVCSHPPNNQFQLTYTDSSNAYTWTFRVFVREQFVGRGTYDTSVQVQLLENFAGGRYFVGDQTTASARVVVDDFGTNGAYGTVSFSALTGDAGDATVSPQPVPFWCDAIDD